MKGFTPYGTSSKSDTIEGIEKSIKIGQESHVCLL